MTIFKVVDLRVHPTPYKTLYKKMDVRFSRFYMSFYRKPLICKDSHIPSP